LWNRAGAGTEVEVTVPGAIAYGDRGGSSVGDWLKAVATAGGRVFPRRDKE
jgi:hypothetical protein